MMQFQKPQVSNLDSVSVEEVETVEEVLEEVADVKIDPTQLSWKQMIEHCRGKSGFWHFGYSGC